MSDLKATMLEVVGPSGCDLGVLMDEMRRAGHPVHLASRAFSDLLADGRIWLDYDQRVIEVKP